MPVGELDPYACREQLALEHQPLIAIWRSIFCSLKHACACMLSAVSLRCYLQRESTYLTLILGANLFANLVCACMAGPERSQPQPLAARWPDALLCLSLQSLLCQVRACLCVVPRPCSTAPLRYDLDGVGRARRSVLAVMHPQGT